MISFIDNRQPNCGVPDGPDLNLANHGNDCTTFPNCPFLLNCASTVGPDIETCQKNGKKILLSLGGAVGSYGFTSDSQATAFATTIWDMFFKGNNSANIRPFGDTVLDGIDLDIEGGSSVGYGAFFNKLRDLMNGDKSKEYILSGAPQCVYPDAYLGPGSGKALTVAASDFSFVNVQFYNNYCGVFDQSQFIASYKQWDGAANSGGYKINVGIPACSGAGGGYISPSAACNLVSTLRTYKSFNGFMLWDTSWDNKCNFAMSTALRKCL